MESNTEFIKKRWELMPRIVKMFWAIPPAYIDGAIMTLIGFMTGLGSGMGNLLSIFSNDETYKYVSPYVIFWTKITLNFIIVLSGALAASLVALQSFRNKTFAEHQARQEKQTTEQTTS